MNRVINTSIVAAAAAATSGSAFGAIAHITADNHYALYTGSETNAFMVGHGELHAGGDPGRYNWSEAEEWRFVPGDYIYIAAWSDDAVAQGLLADFTINGEKFFTGDDRWEVYATGVDIDTGGAAPDVGLMGEHLLRANDRGWSTPFVGGHNGVAPWRTIGNVSELARWTWAEQPEPGMDTINGGADYDEFLIFRTYVPTPGMLTISAAAGLLVLRRKPHGRD